MEKKEIKDKLAELVEDGAVTLREALDLEDNEVEFLSKCHSNNFSFYNDELADVSYDDNEERIHAFGSAWPGGSTKTKFEGLMQLYRDKNISHETHLVRSYYDDYEPEFVIVNKDFFYEREKQLANFKKRVGQEVQSYLDSLSLEKRIFFFELFAYNVHEHLGFILKDRELTFCLYYEYLMENTKNNFCSFHQLEFDSDKLKLVKR